MPQGPLGAPLNADGSFAGNMDGNLSRYVAGVTRPIDAGVLVK